ncbi:MAG: nucleotidyl transferase AbiEii/AbiGii toxin family protein [Kofleriaceae bacterium]|nr:nucleotidyl transferase AbiEii/AbiGii toxin family protein [Kofleriaceae bacterium]
MTLRPHLDKLPPAQRALWAELATVPPAFVLYGGTALALRLGHRESADFDFFSDEPLDHAALEAAVPFLAAATTLQQAPNTRTVLVRRSDREIKLSWFGGLGFGRVGAPELTDDGVLRVASLLDLAGTTLKALLQRVEAKDYLDVDAVLGAGVPIQDILGAARALFGTAFNPIVARKALSYFEGGDLGSLPPGVRARLVEAAVADVEASPLQVQSARLAP